MADPVMAADRCAEQLKQVLRLMPAPVGIVSSRGADGAPVGLAVSAIMPVSLEPCAVATAINRSGSAHRPILDNGRFCLNLVGPESVEHFMPFASADARERRFAADAWPEQDGLPYLADAPASLFCAIEDVVSYGTHDVVIGRVLDLRLSAHPASLAWCDGALAEATALALA